MSIKGFTKEFTRSWFWETHFHTLCAIVFFEKDKKNYALALSEHLGIKKSAVAKQLDTLKNNGLLTEEIQGKTKYVTINYKRIVELFYIYLQDKKEQFLLECEQYEATKLDWFSQATKILKKLDHAQFTKNVLDNPILLGVIKEYLLTYSHLLYGDRLVDNINIRNRRISLRDVFEQLVFYNLAEIDETIREAINNQSAYEPDVNTYAQVCGILQILRTDVLYFLVSQKVANNILE